MYKNPFLVILAAIAALVVFNGAGAIMTFFGVSVLTITAILLALSLGSCVIVAAKDPDSHQGKGYYFGAMIAAAMVGACLGSDMVLLLVGAVVGALHPFVMWRTYRVRRRREARRLLARMREDPPSHVIL